MSEFVTTSFSVGPIGAGASLVYAAAIGHNQARLFKTKVVPVGGTGTFDHGIYKHATCLAADVVAAWQAVPTSPGLFDPMESAGSGPTERNEGEPIFYEDLDAGSNIHGKITNNDAGARSFNVSITYQIGETTDFVLIEGAAPTLRFSQTGAPTDERYWQMSYGSHSHLFQLVNDALSVGATFMLVNRSGNTVSSVVFPNGNVGIGMTPLQALDVTGNLRISGNFMRSDNAGTALNFGTVTNTHYNDTHEFRNAIGGTLQADINNSGIGIGGTPIASGSMALTIRGTSPAFNLYESAAALDTKLWDLVATGGVLYHRLVSDSVGSANTWMQVTRVGTTPTSVVFPTGLVGIGGSPTVDLHVFGGGQFRVEAGAFARHSFVVSSAGVDQKKWQNVANFSTIYWSALNDAENAETQFMLVTRGTGTAVSSVSFPANSPVRFSDGTAANPVISFINQTNKGFWNRGTHDIGVALAGTDYFTFNPSFFGSIVPGWPLSFGNRAFLVDIGPNVLGQFNGDNPQELRIYGALTGSKYLTFTHDGTNGSINTSVGNIVFSPAGGSLLPITDGTKALGSTNNRWSIGVFSAYLSVGTNPAGAGSFRLPNIGLIMARNAANNADYALGGLDASNNTFFGDPTTPIYIRGSAASFFGATAVGQQTAAALTNNMTAGGTNEQVDTWSSLTVYATDAAAIRDAVYQLARKVAQLTTGLRNFGLFT